MKNAEKIDRILTHALSPTAEPSQELNQEITRRLRDTSNARPVYRKKLSAAFIVAILTFAMSLTVFAAWRLLDSGQVAEHLQDRALAQAFRTEHAIEINQSILSGGYNIALLGIVSGEGLSDFAGSAQDIHPDRTYAVVSIAKQDGSPMPDTQDEEYSRIQFFVSPLIKGQKPWQVNIITMSGGYSEFVKEGILYRLIECDGIEMFADRGVYLCVNSGDFYDNDAYSYNEGTGELVPNTEYKGVNALFDLPLDAAKADYEKAEKYLKDLLQPDTTPKNSEEVVDWEKEVADWTVIPGSEKEVTYDEKGSACYEYDRHRVGISVEHHFKKDEIGIYKTVCINGNGDSQIAIQFIKRADGVVAARALRKNPKQ